MFNKKGGGDYYFAKVHKINQLKKQLKGNYAQLFLFKANNEVFKRSVFSFNAILLFTFNFM
jgi:hypothetical protein